MSHEHKENSKPASENVPKILASLDFQDDTFPRQALLDAREHRDEIIPELLRAFEENVRVIESDEKRPWSWLPTMAMNLLVEFRCKELLPIMLHALRLPCNQVDLVFGDSLMDAVPGMLHHLGAEEDDFDTIIRDRKSNEFVRWSMLSGFFYFARDGRLSQDELIECLRTYLNEAVETRDYDLTAPLIDKLSKCGAVSALPDIENAYAKGVVNEDIISIDDVRKHLNEDADETAFQGVLDALQDGFSDCISRMEGWYCFQPKKKIITSNVDFSNIPVTPPREPKVPTFSPSHQQVLPSHQQVSSVPIRNENPHVGRNDPCPCGSGKKHKKCCLMK